MAQKKFLEARHHQLQVIPFCTFVSFCTLASLHCLSFDGNDERCFSEFLRQRNYARDVQQFLQHTHPEHHLV